MTQTNNNYNNINNNNNYNNVIERLQYYMLNGKVLACNNYYMKPTKNIIKNTQPVTVKQIVNERFFIPQEKDSLFWCYYIMKNGFEKYEYPGVSSFVSEKNIKFECIDFLRKNKHLLKNKKIRNIKEQVEDELANKSEITMKTFISLCVGSNLNVLYIHKKKCFDMIVNEGQPTWVVHQRDTPKLHYVLEMDVTSNQCINYKNNYFKWESVEKPLKAISSYKLQELRDLYTQLDLETNDMNKKTKKELYEDILLNM